MEKPHTEPPKGVFTPNGVSKPAPELPSLVARAPQRKPFPPGVDAEQVNRAMIDIDNGEKSDLEGPDFEADLQVYLEKGRKRLMESYRAEQISRKVNPKFCLCSQFRKHTKYEIASPQLHSERIGAVL
jgi:DNA helicase INO80